ncbi:uncharacterized protein LOC127361039 [Dicentrarchus labrax]|uniref:uncharacterized protein LOC127361039 n=1 Tax=Dicentrarchus labrax TaxID=13489 RepID=UPI0021F507DF|nr:uncharacterized protein LOC127361039 [Dicentrarchus labrax]
MRTELKSLRLWPGSHHMLKPGNALSLWRLPPQPELIDTVSVLPSRNFFQLHPFFIWKPESDIMVRLRNNYILPCLHGCPKPDVVSAGVGRPRVIVGTSGQYYVFASRLRCRTCKRIWFADSPRWLDILPKRFTNILPAFLTYKKAICKSVLHELRRSGKSPSDMANQVNELMHLKYEQSHLAYLHSIQNVWDAEAGVYGQKTLGQLVQKDDTPQPFGAYDEVDGWCGVSVSAHYLTDCLINEYRHQEPAIIKLLQGTFGQVLRSDHTRKVARKVTLSSDTMSSYAVMNENWMVASWVMVQSEMEKSLEPMYQGLARRYNNAGVEKANYHWVDRVCCAAFRIPDLHHGEHFNWDAWRTTPSIVTEATAGTLENACASRTHYNSNIVVKLDLFHSMRRFTRECTSEHHPLFSTFCQLLSAAFSVVDQEDLQKLKDAYQFCGIQPPTPTKLHIREHCRIRIPQSTELVDRVEKVLQHFHLTTDPNNVPLYKPSTLKTWRIQRVHILRGCLSDPVVTEGIMYRYGGTPQLNHVPGEGAKVPIWIPVRGTSQQEGYHFHQSQWITGTHVSCELFQAQGMTGVARWNYKRLLDLKRPDVILPPVFDPLLITELNSASKRVTGKDKYPILHLSERDTEERFGLEYVEPECRPVPLDWNKHRSQKKEESSIPVPLPPGPTPSTNTAPPNAVPMPQPPQVTQLPSPVCVQPGHIDKAG